MELVIKKDTPTKPFNKHWQFCVGSGRASLALRTDYCRLLRRVQEDLGISRVRFHGIFHDDMHTLHSMRDFVPLPGAKRFTEQSFRLCGLAYDNVLDCGMQPFVELGFMPRMLAKRNKRGLFYYKPNISMPKSDAAWARYIQDFIRFLLRRYGEKEVESWYFEVWNEPDLRIAFFDGTQADYFHLYEVTVRAIKEVNSKLMVGGPATSGSKWVDDFIVFCKARGIPPDFVSTHQYAGDPVGGVLAEEEQGKKEKIAIPYGKILHLLGRKSSGSFLEGLRNFMGDPSESRDISGDTFIKNAAIVQNQAQGLPVYYTEWNTNATFSAYTNDTRKVAAYDVKMALAVEDYVAGSSIWCFSDIFEELHPFPEEFHGGFGMLSQHGIPKPVFHAMKMLADAGSERYILPDVLEGEISAAAFKGKGGVQAIFVRQNMKNLSLPKECAQFSVELGAPPKSVSVRFIDEERGNPLKLWEEMGRPIDLTPHEVKEICEKSAVSAEALEYTYQDGFLHCRVNLGVNDLAFAEIVTE